LAFGSRGDRTKSGLPRGNCVLLHQHVISQDVFIPRSDLLANTGKWRDSDVMDGSDTAEPAGSLKRLLSKAHRENLDVHIFGRFYSEGAGLHDVHLNQGSTQSFIHRPGNDSNDHNDVWQDGAMLVDVGSPEWAAYFSAFNQQLVPTDDLGNPLPGGTTI
jgi:uncharacterized protein YukJ